METASIERPLAARTTAAGRATEPFKEITFEIAGASARIPHLAWVIEHPAMSVRVESVQSRGDAVWEVAFASGPPGDVAGLVDVLRAPAAPPVGAIDAVVEDARAVRWFVRWDRPAPDQVPSLFHIVFDRAGPDALVMPRISRGRIEVRVACRSADDLKRLYREVERVYASRFAVRLVRVGPLRGGRPPVPEEDRELLAKAIEAGYYDEPKRVGVRELGRVLGWSKTVISRRLRALERRAVERLATEP